MSLMLLKRSVEVLVGAVLVALMLAVVPAVAEAKEGAEAGTKAATHEEQEAQSAKAKRGAAEATHAAHTDATRTDAPHTVVVVVRPGDSLWSISEEHLGPNATAQRIDRHTERLWALNRHQIGADPDLILVGQELLVPSVGENSVGERWASSTSGTPAKGEATRRRQTTRTQEEQAGGGSARVSATGRATEANKTGQAPEQASEQAPGQAPGQASERVILPEVADAQPVPAARPPISDPISDPTSIDSSFPSLAVALVAWALLTLVAALVTWVLLTVVAFLVLRALHARGRKRQARKRDALQAVLGTNYTCFDPFWGYILDSEQTPWRPPSASGADDATTDEEESNGLDHLGLLATARARRERVRRGRTGRVVRAARRQRSRAQDVGAYGPEVFRAMLRGARRPRSLKTTKLKATKLNGRAERARRTRRRSR